VIALRLRLGPLSGVVKDALLFSYDVAAAGTALEGSRLVIEEVPVIVFCQSCNQRRTIETIQLLCCSVCGELTPEVVSGRELQIVAMELEDTATEDAAISHAVPGTALSVAGA
jgi:hydrogenase nickel incorporation protein HypA/HybF